MSGKRFWRGEYSSVLGVPIMEGEVNGMLAVAVMCRVDKREALRMADVIVDALNKLLESREAHD